MEDKEIRLSSMRRVIGDRMCQSLRETAQYTLFREIEVDALLGYVKELKDCGQDLKFMHLLVKICASLLKRHEKLNASIQEKKLLLHGNVNMGVAVALKEGLVVPVIQGANRLTPEEIAEEYGSLVLKARSGRLTEGEMSGGTFTISNLGVAGIDAFTPVVNYPESSILGVGRARKMVAVLDDDSFCVKHTIFFSLTLDHRIVDGYVGAMFLEDLAGALGSREKIIELISEQE